MVNNVNNFAYDKSQQVAVVKKSLTMHEYVLLQVLEKKPELQHAKIHHMEKRQLFDEAKGKAPDIKVVPDINYL